MRLTRQILLTVLLLGGCVQPPPGTSTPDSGISLDSASVPDAEISPDSGSLPDIGATDTGDGDTTSGGDASAIDATVPIVDAGEDASESQCATLPAPHLRWSFDSLDPKGFVSEGTKEVAIVADGATVDPNGRFGGALKKLRSNLPWANHDAAFELPVGTITFWFQPQRIDIVQGLVSKDADGEGDGHLHIALERAPADGTATRVTARLQQLALPGIELETPNLVEVGKWYFVALRWDGVSATLFLDGEMRSVQPFLIGLESNKEPLGVGFGTTHSTVGSHVEARETSNAMIDELVFWAEALSDEQLRSLYGEPCF